MSRTESHEKVHGKNGKSKKINGLLQPSQNPDLNKIEVLFMQFM